MVYQTGVCLCFMWHEGTVFPLDRMLVNNKVTPCILLGFSSSLLVSAISAP